MNKKLWEASNAQKKKSLLSSYEQFISKRYKKKFNQKYESILKWSIKNRYYYYEPIGCKEKRSNRHLSVAHTGEAV